jgi:hypothetical protein
VGEWDLGIGVQSWTGAAGIANSEGTGLDMRATKAFAFDAQAQGAVSGRPLGLYVTYGTADATTTGSTRNLFNSSARIAPP